MSGKRWGDQPRVTRPSISVISTSGAGNGALDSANRVIHFVTVLVATPT
jgi:hypothetical protein